jgi:uncharacterized protein YdhG (YjbR/CyaY superfamily)
MKEPAKRNGKKIKGFTTEERAAMREAAQEHRREASGGRRANGEADALARIAEMPERDRAIATRIHAIVKAQAPDLTTTTWYGMPAYAKEDKVVCFFQPGAKFKTRYATLGFSDKARLDEGAMWPVVFAVNELTAAVEERIGQLVRKAAG